MRIANLDREDGMGLLFVKCGDTRIGDLGVVVVMVGWSARRQVGRIMLNGGHNGSSLGRDYIMQLTGKFCKFVWLCDSYNSTRATRI